MIKKKDVLKKKHTSVHVGFETGVEAMATAERPFCTHAILTWLYKQFPLILHQLIFSCEYK